MLTGDLDEAILTLLQEDARASNREVGRRLNVSEGAVRTRLKRLLEAGAIQFGALVAPEALGLDCTAYVRLTVSPQHLREVANGLAALPAAQFVGLAAGHYNIITVLVTHGRDELQRLLEAEFQSLPGVTAVDVREHVAVLKHRYEQVRIKRVRD